MNMNLASPSTPATIVSGQKTLAIPIYQRLFVWGDKQIDTLLCDLWGAFTNPDKADMERPKDYYLGVITAHENDAQQWEIVDGQQRLTFLTLLGCVLARRFPAEASDWLRFVRADPVKLRLSFHGRLKDMADIENYLSGKQETFQNHAFARFAERFSLFAYGKPDAELKDFSAYCFAHAAFLVNELPKVYGPEELNLYFEKMNSTGRQLTPLEVVKGKWFSPYAAQWNTCMNFDEQADGNEQSGEGTEGLSLADVLNQTEKFKTFFEKTPSKQSNAPKSYKRLVMKGEMLALHVLKIMQACGEIASESEIPLDSRKLIETFGKVKFEPAKFIAQLETYRKWIDQNIIYLDDDDGQSVYAFRTDNLDNDDAVGNDSTDRKCQRQFQAMLYVASGESQKWVLDAYIALKGAGPNGEDASILFDFLRRYDAEKHELNASALSYHKIDRYWFWKLDFLVWEKCFLQPKDADKSQSHCVTIGGANKQTPFSFDEKEWKALLAYKFKRNISIEHLHPQSKGDKEGCPEWGSRDKPESAMHQFGNLAMMSVEGNSAQQDDSIHVKFGRVKTWLESGRLESLKMLLMFHLADQKPEGWIPKVAGQHEKEMIALLEEDQRKWGGAGEAKEPPVDC